MIDTHCHLDQLDNPETIVRRAEAQGVGIVAVTNLPSHYAMSLGPLKGSRHVKPALGLHPLMCAAHPQELMPFLRLAKSANYIGEIGLDFSPKGLPTKGEQIAHFDKILGALQGKPRFVTIHSRQAVPTVVDMLEAKKIGPVVFHWFTGTKSELDRVLSAGHYLSINPAMLATTSGTRVLESTSPDRVLIESDAPYARVAGRKTEPWDGEIVIKHLATIWQKSEEEVESLTDENFSRLMPPSSSD